MLDANINLFGQKKFYVQEFSLWKTKQKKLRLEDIKVESFVTSTRLNWQTVLGGDPTDHCQGLTATDFGGGVSGNIAIDCGGGGGASFPQVCVSDAQSCMCAPTITCASGPCPQYCPSRVQTYCPDLDPFCPKKPA